MKSCMIFFVGSLMACGGASASASAPAPAPGSAPASGSGSGSASASASPPPPATGGSVLIGDIASAKSFDPKPVVLGVQDKLLACYNQARGAKPELHGKLRLRAVVNDAGVVVNVDAEAGGLSTETDLVSCLAGVLRATHFPKPGGMATVTLPMLFRPES